MLSLILFNFMMILLSFYLNWVINFFYLGVFFMILIFFGTDLTFYSMVGMSLGIDFVSWILILLSVFISMLMLLSSTLIYNLKYYINVYLVNVIVLEMLLVFTFSSINLFFFYVMFESSLIPIFMLILGWGYQPERLQAGMYMLLYTLFGSLPLLMGIFYFNSIFGSMSMLMMDYLFNWNFFFFISMILGFMFKLPLFMLHLWLPKAHVEAPVSGSMILAGVLLKLGGYGLVRVSKLFMNGGLVGFYLIIFSLLGGMLIGFMCICQIDVKVIIAYSSVVHMGLMLGGLLTCTVWGMLGSLLIMISHGLCSSGMFYAANIYYERTGSRSLLINRGLMNLFPFMTLFFFFVCSFNGGAPPSMNLWGEIMLIISMVNTSLTSAFLIFFVSFLSVCYSLYLYSYMMHGKMYTFLLSFGNCLVQEYLVIYLHVYPLGMLFLNLTWVMNWL